MASIGGRAPPLRNKRTLSAESHWPAEARGSLVRAPSSSPPSLTEHRLEHRYLPLTALPIHAVSLHCSRSWPPPNIPPPIVTDALWRALEPVAPLVPVLQEKISLSSLGSLLHLLKYWSLRYSRDGSVLANRSAIHTFHTGPATKRMENWKTKNRFPTFPPHDHPSLLKRTTRARPQPRPEDSIWKNRCPRTEKCLTRITAI